MNLAKIFLLPAVQLLLLSVLLSACSTLQVTDAPEKQFSNDPLEKLNRSVYAFNNGVDKLILRPAAKAYDNALPKPAKKGVHHFFANLQEPLNVLNNLLQGKFNRALISTYRFTVNSTVGVFGLFDVAKSYEVLPATEDFGQTLAAWGVGPGPYLMVPFAGPSNLRDGLGRITDSAIFYPIDEITDSSTTRTGLVLLDLLALRAKLLGADSVLDAQLDSYAFLKHAFEQSRIKDIYDGRVPETEDYDF